MSDEKSERGFVVVDKRGREEEEAAEARPQAPEEEPRRAGALPPPDFASLLVSLGTSALYHLGLVNDPATGKPGTPDLALARQAIDTVEMLGRKTEGNLDDDEQKLLASLLADLRMRYVEVRRTTSGA